MSDVTPSMEAFDKYLQNLPESEKDVVMKTITKMIQEGIRVGISSSSKSGSPKVATASDRITDSGHRVGKQFPAQELETQRLANLVSAINRNPFLEAEEKRLAIRKINTPNMRSLMNEWYGNISDAENSLARTILELISPERLARMKKEKLI